MSTKAEQALEDTNATASVDASEPKVTKKHKSLHKGLNNVIATLNGMVATYDMHYILLVADKNMAVTQRGSTDARLLLDRVNAVSTLPSAICLSQMDRSLQALSKSTVTFSELPTPIKCKLVMHILKRVMPKRKQSHPFKETSQEKVVKDYHWWPEDVPYKHPKNLEEGQLVKLVDAIVQSHSRERLQKCLTTLHAMGLSAKDEEAAKIALNRAFAGDAARVAPAHTLPPVLGPSESKLIYVDSKPYLGAEGATDEDIATCLTAHGMSNTRGIKNSAVRICGGDVRLVDLYNAIAAHGGPAEVLSTKAPAAKLLDVATDLGTDTTKNDWRTTYRRSFGKYLEPLMVPGPEVNVADGGEGLDGGGAEIALADITNTCSNGNASNINSGAADTAGAENQDGPNQEVGKRKRTKTAAAQAYDQQKRQRTHAK